jgi:hypothetical protein
MSGYSSGPGISESQSGFTEPSSRVGTGQRGRRYPDPFFDISQQFMPPTIKELFKWCTFYFYNSSLIGPTLRKVSRYPITDLIFEDDSEKVRKLWEDVFDRKLRIKARLLEVNLDYYAYGNSFVSVHLPFTRFLTCKNCKHSAPIKSWTWTYQPTGTSPSGFTGTCSRCSHAGDVLVKDKPYKDMKGVNIVRWNPENITIKYNDYTGKRYYMYSVPRKLRDAVYRGDKDILQDMPIIVLDALRQNKKIRFDENSIFHMKLPTLAEQDQGWGKPLILHVMKDLFYLYTLRRAQEAIAMEHILPLDISIPSSKCHSRSLSASKFGWMARSG